MPENELWINSTVANQLGLVNGEYIHLENQDGIQSDKIRLRVTPGIHPESVYMVHGFDQKSPALRLAYKHEHRILI